MAEWSVEFHAAFEVEFERLEPGVQDALLAGAKALQTLGPQAGRPYVDTLHGSRHPNMKELRFDARGGTEVWRAAFAFDPERRAIVLAAAAKQGVSSRLFYKRLIKIADERFAQHLATVSGLSRRK